MCRVFYLFTGISPNSCYLYKVKTGKYSFKAAEQALKSPKSKNRSKSVIKEGTFADWRSPAIFIDPEFGEYEAAPCYVYGQGVQHPARSAKERHLANINKFKASLPPYLQLVDETYVTSNDYAEFIDLEYLHINGGTFTAKPSKVKSRGQRHPAHGKLLAKLDKAKPIEKAKTLLPPHITIKDDSEYRKMNAPITLIDAKYGEFIGNIKYIADGHLGHPQRSRDAKIGRRIPVDVILERIKAIYPEAELDISTYINTHTPATFTDREYGQWETCPYRVLAGAKHPSRSAGHCRSRGENEIYTYIQSIYDGPIWINKKILNTGSNYKKEIDIYMPDLNLGIEYNGLYYHAEIMADNPRRHVEKRLAAEKQGIRLLQFWEHEWDGHKKDIIKSIIANAIKKNTLSIGARSLDIKDVANADAQEFLRDNHLMGEFVATKYRGLYSGDRLLALMGCSINRKGNAVELEIDRFCVKKYHSIPGALPKLLKSFICSTNPSQVLSFVDLRYGTGHSLIQNGFELSFDGNRPSWGWTDLRNIYNRLKCRANMDSRSLTEAEYADELGWFKIYDAGQARFIKKLK